MSPYEDYRTVEKTSFTVQTASLVPYLRSRPPVRLTLAGEPMGFFTVTDRSFTNASPYKTHLFITSRFKLATSVIIPPPGPYHVIDLTTSFSDFNALHLFKPWNRLH